MPPKKRNLEEDFNEITRMAKHAEKLNETFNHEITSLKDFIAGSKDRGDRLKQRIEEESDNRRQHKEEVETLVSELREAFRRNIERFRRYQEDQLKTVTEKHRNETQKWKDRYNSLKSNQTFMIDERESEWNKELESKVQTLQKNLSDVQAKNDTLKKQLSEAANEKKKTQ